MYCLAPSPNPGTPRLKFVVSSCQNRFNPSRTTQRVLTNGSILIHGPCQTFCCPQDQHRSLYMNASPRPMLQSISSHTGIWPWKSQRIPQTCSTEKNTVKPSQVQDTNKEASYKQNAKQLYILYSAMLGIILQRTIRPLLSLERSSKYRPFLWNNHPHLWYVDISTAPISSDTWSTITPRLKQTPIDLCLCLDVWFYRGLPLGASKFSMSLQTSHVSSNLQLKK